jgi:hypothetical protein
MRRVDGLLDSLGHMPDRFTQDNLFITRDTKVPITRWVD